MLPNIATGKTVTAVIKRLIYPVNKARVKQMIECRE